jgi:uncharacterized delta-60 repeat protein
MQATNSRPIARHGLSRAVVVGALVILAGSSRAQLPAGALDPSFGLGGKLFLDFNHGTDIANGVALQPDGKFVVVGQTYLNNDYSTEDFAVSRHNADGSLDSSFGTGGKVQTDFPGLAAIASSVLVQPDGKILVAGGAFPLFTFAGDFKLVRYNADGTLDGGFGAGGIVTTSFPGQGSYAFALALQPDGKIVAAGTDFVNFSSEQSSNTDFAIARYNPDGTPDASFGSGGKLTTDFGGLNDDAFSILVQPDGKLVAVGSARDLIDDYDIAAARYLPNGALDGSFGTGGKVHTDLNDGAFDRARAAVLQPDGKIVAAGFSSFNNTLSQPFVIVRYLANGALDTSFAGDGEQEIDFGSFDQSAYAILLQPDGKLVTAGYPNTESSDSDFLLARSNPDGTLDTSFGVGGKVRTNFGKLNGGAYGAARLPDGRILAVGFQATTTADGVQIAMARYSGGGAWEDHGGALAGALGAPLLVGTGDLSAASANAVTLSNALPSAPSALFLAFSSAPVPFKGGTLQPFPFVGPFLMSTNGAGAIAIPFTMPSGVPAGTQLWLQWAIQDGAAVQGVALSNAILGLTP